MSEFENVISIEENAQYLLNSNSDLQTDANISSAIIYQNVKKYKRGYQPLLNSPIPHDSPNTTREYFDFPSPEPPFQDEDILLNPNKPTLSIGGQSYLDNDMHFSEPKTARHRSLTPPIVRVTSFSSRKLTDPTIGRKDTDAMFNVDWNTANWTAIFMHFHSVEHTHYIYPCVMIIGMIFIVGIMFMELFIIPPSTFIFCRYLNWVLLILFCYMFAFVISYSKVSTKRWVIMRDYLYVIFWINSLLAILIGIFMKCLPFANGIENNFEYINCANDDYDCMRYKNKYNISDLEMDIFIVVAHSIPFIYCIAMSTMFTHKDSFQKSCKEIMVVELISIIWCFWNIFSYIVTRKWTYRGIDKLYKNNSNQDIWIEMIAILIVILIVMFILYWICYIMHHQCRLCEHNYSRYFKQKTLAAKMIEKERELSDMPDIDDAFSSGIAL